MKIKPRGQSHHVYLHRKFHLQLRSFYSFGGKVRITRLSKTEKNCDFHNGKWRHQNKKVYQIIMIIYQSRKFHENRPNRFREILCTTSVRKKIRRRIEKKKQYNNNKIFRWKRKTLIKGKKKPKNNYKVFRWRLKTLIEIIGKKKPKNNNKVFRWRLKTLMIGKKKPKNNNKVFRWRRKTLIILTNIIIERSSVGTENLN